MKIILSLFLWLLFSVYAVNFLIFAIICSYLFPMHVYEPWLKFLFRVFIRLSGNKVIIEGKDNISKEKVYLFMSNHVSIFDIAILAGYIPNNFRGIEAERQFKWPLYGFAIKRLGNIPINRTNPTAAMKSIDRAKNNLKKGLSMMVLPEGHRTLTGEMKPFKQLPFHLAKICERELVPIGLSGLFSLKRKGSWLINPGRIQIKFGKPIPVDLIEEMSVDELKKFTRVKIQELIDYK